MPASTPSALPQAVLFDMDGLLLDSERLARRCYVAACREAGWEPDLDAYHRCVGSTYEATERILRSAHGDRFPFEQVAARWSAQYQTHIESAPVAVKPGARELLEWLERRKLPCGLATSTRRAHAELKLRHAGLDGYFAALVCGGETSRGKPHPDPYLAVSAALGVPAECCWALEDSHNGTRAALAAGCITFQVPDLVPPVAGSAHFVVTSLTEVLGLAVSVHGEHG